MVAAPVGAAAYTKTNGQEEDEGDDEEDEGDGDVEPCRRGGGGGKTESHWSCGYGACGFRGERRRIPESGVDSAGLSDGAREMGPGTEGCLDEDVDMDVDVPPKSNRREEDNRDTGPHKPTSPVSPT